MQEFSSLTVAVCPFSVLSQLYQVAGCDGRSKEDCHGSCGPALLAGKSRHSTFHQHQRCEMLESTLKGNAIPV